MNIFNRAITSLKRQWGKTLILLITVGILGFLLISATMVRNAILQTEHNLWSNMPRISAINLDFEVMQELIREARETGDDSLLEFSGASPEIIREIGSLPYVESFNYTFYHDLWNSDLQRYEQTLRAESDNAFWTVQGVYNPNLLDLETGLIQIVAGRSFVDTDMEGIGQAILISQELAAANNLTVGSIITLESRVYDDFDHVYANNDWLNLERIVELEAFELEVIGLFEVMTELTEEDKFDEIVIGGSVTTMESVELIRLRTAQNQMYLPISVIEASPSFDFERASQLEVNGVEAQFLLYNALDLPNFTSEANLLLSGWWRMADLSGNFSRISASMETMQWIADTIFFGGMGAIVIILGLFMILFLYDRKREIGIYLALGEKRGKVIFQVLIEVLLLATLSLSLSIFTGSMVSTRLSQSLLEQDLIRQVESGENQFWGINNLSRHNPGEMSIEEMMTSFEISVEVASVGLVLAVGLATVLLSTSISMFYVVKLNPKKMLL